MDFFKNNKKWKKKKLRQENEQKIGRERENRNRNWLSKSFSSWKIINGIKDFSQVMRVSWGTFDGKKKPTEWEGRSPASLSWKETVDEGGKKCLGILNVWECKKQDGGCVTQWQKDVFIYDRMAMLRREMLTLSMLAERFKFARKISDANLSSQTRDMASSCNLKKKGGNFIASAHLDGEICNNFCFTLVAFSFVKGSAGKFISFASASVRKSK